jgi:hypothetical protein
MTGTYRTTQRACDRCGAIYPAKLCKLARGVGRYCSVSCAAVNNIALVDRRRSKGPFAPDDPRRTRVAAKAIIDLSTRENTALIAAFMARLVPCSDDECWLWQGSSGSDGYGLLTHRGATYRATRLSWQLANDEPLGQRVIMHRCDNPPCVNPAHLSPGTQRENMQDMALKGRGRRQGAEMCVRGHPFDDRNSHLDTKRGKPRRRCKLCMADEQRRYRVKKHVTIDADRRAPVYLAEPVKRTWL